MVCDPADRRIVGDIVFLIDKPWHRRAPDRIDMQATPHPLRFLANNASRLLLAVFAAASLLTAGCAEAITQVTPAQARPLARADVIYVYPFATSAGEVKLDTGMANRLKTTAGGTTDAGKQANTARQAQEQVADAIVHKLQAMGLPAVRATGPVPAAANALIVEGDLEKIDEGRRRRRMLIGLGAGKSEVGAQVQVLYKPANGVPMPLQSFAADADSGHMPGMAETAGVGAAVGHVATAAAAGAGLHGASELKRDSIPALAERLGDSIAQQVAQASAANGWVPATRI